MEEHQSFETPADFCCNKRRNVPEYSNIQKSLSFTNRNDLSSFLEQKLLL
jgi:hypothetical protein